MSDSSLLELSILESAAEEIARLRYNAYLLFDENERLSNEIYLRATEIMNIVSSRISQLKQVIPSRGIVARSVTERLFVSWRKRPDVNYSISGAAPPDAISSPDSCDPTSLTRH